VSPMGAYRKTIGQVSPRFIRDACVLKVSELWPVSSMRLSFPCHATTLPATLLLPHLK
jgi:hypothetical protein